LIIDCGANIGLVSVMMKCLFPDVKIIAIEPDETNFELLKKNLQHYEGIELINAGI
jgi:FkbM family methyltransferase